MIVYHGSVFTVDKPKIIKSNKGRDFGCAFYTTDIKEQAERWALRRARFSNRFQEGKYQAIVSVYEYNSDNGLYIKTFDSPDEEWLDMVLKCRSNPLFSSEYDIVMGKIANDNVGETVVFVMQGIMRKEDALDRLKFQKINNQIAFCSEKALRELTFVDTYTVSR